MALSTTTTMQRTLIILHDNLYGMNDQTSTKSSYCTDSWCASSSPLLTPKPVVKVLSVCNDQWLAIVNATVFLLTGIAYLRRFDAGFTVSVSTQSVMKRSSFSLVYSNRIELEVTLLYN